MNKLEAGNNIVLRVPVSLFVSFANLLDTIGTNSRTITAMVLPLLGIDGKNAPEPEDHTKEVASWLSSITEGKMAGKIASVVITEDQMVEAVVSAEFVQDIIDIYGESITRTMPIVGAFFGTVVAAFSSASAGINAVGEGLKPRAEAIKAKYFPEKPTKTTVVPDRCKICGITLPESGVCEVCPAPERKCTSCGVAMGPAEMGICDQCREDLRFKE